MLIILYLPALSLNLGVRVCVKLFKVIPMNSNEFY